MWCLEHQIPRITDIQPTQHRRWDLAQAREEDPGDALHVEHAPERRRVSVVLLVEDTEEHDTEVDQVGAKVDEDTEAHIPVYLIS